MNKTKTVKSVERKEVLKKISIFTPFIRQVVGEKDDPAHLSISPEVVSQYMWASSSLT